jgi:hypothetical protein
MRILNKLIGFALLAVAIGSMDTWAQVHSVALYGSYSFATLTRLDVDNAHAWGAGVRLRIGVAGPVQAGITGGYEQYAIEQENELNLWNWKFWNERYAGIVKDNLASDSTLHASFDTVQTMEVIPVLLTVEAMLSPVEDLVIRPSVGAGLLFYTRKLYLGETWSRSYNQIDYTFQYSYRNFANNKTGNPLAVVAGLELSYTLTDLVSLDAGAHYRMVVATPGSLGFDEFPYEGALSFALGLSILY